MAQPIVIVDYRPEWPLEFERLRDRASAAVGEVAIAIEHLGSTAVPGLAAKDLVDLVIVVEPGDVPSAIDRLSAIGCVHRGNLGVEGREAFDAPKRELDHHLYVSPTDSEELGAQLAFRDRLRESPEARGEVRGAQARPRGAIPQRPHGIHGGENRLRDPGQPRVA